MEEPSKVRQSSSQRWLYFLLGVFLAASVGLAIALIVTKVNDDDDDQSATAVTQAIQATVTPSAGTQDPCVDPDCVLRAGELIAAMDREVDPCEDFHQYACGNWIQTHSIPESQSSYSRFGEIRDSVRLKLKGLLGQPYDSNKEGSSIRKAKRFYQSCIDEAKLKEEGVEPLGRLVSGLATWPLLNRGQNPRPLDLESVLVKLAKLDSFPLLRLWVEADEKNSSLYIPYIRQPSFGIFRDYLLKGRNSTEVMTYEELLRQLAVQVLKSNMSTLATDIADVVDFEIELAKMSASRADQRNSEKYYKKLTVADLLTTVPKFNWLKFLSGYSAQVNITIERDTEVVLFAEDYLNSLFAMYEKYQQQNNTKVVANYLLMRTLLNFYQYLSKDIRDLKAPLDKVLLGVTQAQARWKTCVDDVGSTFMPTAVGQLYVKNYFTPTAKQKALEMIGYIRDSMKQMIGDVTWMDDATKNKAFEKADAMVQKIGYPDYQFNETALEELFNDVNPQADAFFQNVLDYTRASVKRNALKLKRKPDKKEWVRSASTVNAWYSPSKNTITFPAGILNPPFYGEDFPMSMMFGGIGMVIGHEMSHGFDDQGRKFDKEGNNVPWWSASSVRQFEQLTQCYVNQYSKQVVAGEHVNGNLTLGENIADNGGIKAAFMAFQNWQNNNQKQAPLPGLGLSHEQLFFVNFAQGWCYLGTDEGARNRLLTDPHSPASVRIRVPLTNSPQFAEAFKCRANSAMNPGKKCHLW
ncbi:neprilysin-1-like [Littorina saxatilis]|uniref:neprilysin-1-like n=1 Tax=Littorina saxatilis TaxID=31220 RepID=UPI0038B445D7